MIPAETPSIAWPKLSSWSVKIRRDIGTILPRKPIHWQPPPHDYESMPVEFWHFGPKLKPKALTADHALDIRDTEFGGRSGPHVPSHQLSNRRPEINFAKEDMTFKANPVANLTAMSVSLVKRAMRHVPPTQNPAKSVMCQVRKRKAWLPKGQILRDLHLCGRFRSPSGGTGGKGLRGVKTGRLQCNDGRGKGKIRRQRAIRGTPAVDISRFS